MRLTDVLAKTFQLCWVTNNLDQAMDYFKTKFDIERFLVMDDVPFVDVVYCGKAPASKGDVRAAWANAGHINLELVEPRSGFPLDLYGSKVSGNNFKIAFHHIGVRFDEDLKGYEIAVKALQTKGYALKITAGIQGISKFAYFDMEAELGHYLELIYFNTEGVAFMDKLNRGEF